MRPRVPTMQKGQKGEKKGKGKKGLAKQTGMKRKEVLQRTDGKAKRRMLRRSGWWFALVCARLGADQRLGQATSAASESCSVSGRGQLRSRINSDSLASRGASHTTLPATYAGGDEHMRCCELKILMSSHL